MEEVSLTGYGLLAGGMSRQAVHQFIQKDKISPFIWWRRRMKNMLIPQAVSLNTRIRHGHGIVAAAKRNMEFFLNRLIQYMNSHRKKLTCPRGYSNELFAKLLKVDLHKLKDRRCLDVVDILKVELFRLIDQLIKLGQDMMSCPEDKWIACGATVREVIDKRFMIDKPELPKPLTGLQRAIIAMKAPDWTDPFCGAFDR
jgi:hypothetical protein